MVGHDTEPRRRSIRLKGYDYSEAGAYFVTVVARDRFCLFSEIVEGRVRLTSQGRLVANAWKWLEAQYSYVGLDEYVIMPNHLHGIIMIAADENSAPTRRKPLGRLVGAFKTVSTKQVNLSRGTPGSHLWQRNYYERVIRDEDELHSVREYIVNNPLQWDLDAENPDIGELRRKAGEGRFTNRPYGEAWE